MSESKKRKVKKTKDRSVCCKTCIFFNGKDKNCKLCSLDGKCVEEDDLCKSYSNERVECCQRCGRKIHYKNSQEYFNALIDFSMTSGSGSSSSQSFHLCRKCESEAFLMFQDMLEKLKHDTVVETA